MNLTMVIAPSQRQKEGQNTKLGLLLTLQILVASPEPMVRTGRLVPAPKTEPGQPSAGLWPQCNGFQDARIPALPNPDRQSSKRRRKTKTPLRKHNTHSGGTCTHPGHPVWRPDLCRTMAPTSTYKLSTSTFFPHFFPTLFLSQWPQLRSPTSKSPPTTC